MVREFKDRRFEKNCETWNIFQIDNSFDRRNFDVMKKKVAVLEIANIIFLIAKVFGRASTGVKIVDLPLKTESRKEVVGNCSQR